MFIVTNHCRGPKALLFLTNQTKVQILDYGRPYIEQMYMYQGVLSPLLSQTEGKKDCLTTGYEAIGPLHELIMSRDQLSVNTKTVHF